MIPTSRGIAKLKSLKWLPSTKLTCKPKLGPTGILSTCGKGLTWALILVLGRSPQSSSLRPRLIILRLRPYNPTPNPYPAKLNPTTGTLNPKFDILRGVSGLCRIQGLQAGGGAMGSNSKKGFFVFPARGGITATCCKKPRTLNSQTLDLKH